MKKKATAKGSLIKTRLICMTLEVCHTNKSTTDTHKHQQTAALHKDLSNGPINEMLYMCTRRCVCRINKHVGVLLYPK